MFPGGLLCAEQCSRSSHRGYSTLVVRAPWGRREGAVGVPWGCHEGAVGVL